VLVGGSKSQTRCEAATESHGSLKSAGDRRVASKKVVLILFGNKPDWPKRIIQVSAAMATFAAESGLRRKIMRKSVVFLGVVFLPPTLPITFIRQVFRPLNFQGFPTPVFKVSLP
jgi:hypothetical protein